MNAPFPIGHNGGPPLSDRWYQEEAVDGLFTYFNEHGGTGKDGRPIPANPLVVMPTGTGKSVVIARFLNRVFDSFPTSRVIMGTHVKELIEQNARKVVQAWPNAPLGIYSAGLGMKDHLPAIVFGGIKSMVGRVDEHGRSLFGHRDLLVIDEAQLVSPKTETSYVQFILELLAVNPYLKVIGLTATPYRLGLGCLTNGNIFTDIAYNISDIPGFARLIAEGYLSPIFPKKTRIELDISDVGLSSTGDFNEHALQAAVDKRDINFAALTELVEHGWQRRSWLLFASGIEHAEHLAEMLRSTFGINAAAVHSKLGKKDRDAIIAAFKSGELRAIVNKDILTTGFDHPPIDLIGMFRPTVSTGLWVQMLGRGTRPYDCTKPDQYIPGFEFTKHHCLVLDYAGNTRRLGPINDPVIPLPKGKGRAGDAPVKICGECGAYNHASARQCMVCGVVFPMSVNIVGKAGTEELLRSDLPVVEYFDVQRVLYTRHVSKKGNRMIKVAYFCNGLRTFYEYITVELDSFAGKRGRDWFRQRAPVEPPLTNDEILANAEYLRTPRRIRVWLNKVKNPEVLSYEF